MEKKKRNIMDYLGGLLHRYDSRRLTPEEHEALSTWQPKVALPQLDDEETEILDLYSRHIWTRLTDRLHLEEVYPHRRRALWTGWRKVAAVITVAICLGGGGWIALSRPEMPWMAQAEQKVRRAWETAPRQRLRLELPDGSVVTLNGGSRLEMGDGLGQTAEEREVWLSGEAFFEVSKDPKRPFIVHSGALQTLVHGTSFNVKAYPSLGEQVVSVRDGRVEVMRGARSLVLLTADKQLSYQLSSGQAAVEAVDGRQVAGWRDGHLVLNGAGAEELRLRLEQQFGLRVRMKGDPLGGRRVLGVFAPGESPRGVLDALCVIYPIRYTLQRDEIIIYGN